MLELEQEAVELLVKMMEERGQTAEEVIASFEKKEKDEIKRKQMEMRAKRKNALESERARKARTRALIQVGGAVSSVLGRSIISGDAERLISFLSQARSSDGMSINEFFSLSANQSI